MKNIPPKLILVIVVISLIPVMFGLGFVVGQVDAPKFPDKIFDADTYCTNLGYNYGFMGESMKYFEEPGVIYYHCYNEPDDNHTAGVEYYYDSKMQLVEVKDIEE